MFTTTATNTAVDVTTTTATIAGVVTRHQQEFEFHTRLLSLVSLRETASV
jgi:hypothetical protein